MSRKQRTKNIGSNLWMVDANDVNFGTTYVLYETSSIKKFLGDNKTNFVCATKGWGKTLLLKEKRKRLNTQGYFCIPTDNLLDTPSDTYLSYGGKEFLENFRRWIMIWKLAIIMSVFKNLKIYKSEYYKELSHIECPIYRKIMSEDTIVTPCDHLGLFLTVGKKYGISQKELSELIDILTPLISAYKHTRDLDIAIFIDNLDEAFKHTLPGYSDNTNVDPDDYRNDIVWYYSQLALTNAVFDLKKENSRINVYASIRKQALQKLDVLGEMKEQVYKIIYNLTYARDDIKEMFRYYIEHEERSNLVLPGFQRSNPFLAFFGTEHIPHSIVKGETENIFDNVYRHTLQRPRDVVEICSNIDNDGVKPRNVEELKTLINKSAELFGTNYLAECKAFLACMEPEILKKFVKENVIRREDIFNICHQFNKEINKTKSSWRCRRKCSDCEAEYHPFCGLYNVGLLGFIAKSDYSEAFVQKFLVPGESLVFNSLPISDYYLVHPCLQRVLSLNLNEDNIIGYGLPWKTKLKNGRKNNIGNKYANFLAKIDHIYTEDYNVIGDYVRFEEQIRNQLQEDCHQIINSLSNKSDSYENYLIWALPGTGKTSMVKEVIKNIPFPVEFIEINLAKVSEEQLIEKLHMVKQSILPTICFVDEIDSRLDEDWPFVRLFAYLDLNKTKNNNFVFIFAGSDRSGLEIMERKIQEKAKGEDFLSRIPDDKRIIIPSTSIGDKCIVAVNKIIVESSYKQVRIHKVEKTALYYWLVTGAKSPRELENKLTVALNQLDKCGSSLRYEDIFERGDYKMLNFWVEHGKYLDKLRNTFVSIG